MSSLRRAVRRAGEQWKVTFTFRGSTTLAEQPVSTQDGRRGEVGGQGMGGSSQPGPSQALCHTGFFQVAFLHLSCPLHHTPLPWAITFFRGALAVSG